MPCTPTLSAANKGRARRCRGVADQPSTPHPGRSPANPEAFHAELTTPVYRGTPGHGWLQTPREALTQAGIIESSPSGIVDQSTDGRVVNELKRTGGVEAKSVEAG
jgi:hypothetical protein